MPLHNFDIVARLLDFHHHFHPIAKIDDHHLMPAPKQAIQAPDKKHQPKLELQLQQQPYVVYQPIGHPKQALIDNEIWPPIFKPEFVRSAKSMQPRDTDVFVCSYPKCGTTWIQHICSQLIADNYGPDVGRELCVTSPMIERMGDEFVDNLDHPRVLKTHFQWPSVPKNAHAKYIYACRNPKDCLTSYYFHHRNFKIYNFADGDFNTFFDLFFDGAVGFGDYFDHLLGWLPHLYDANVLFLKYEDMLEDLPGAVVKIGQFIGGRAAERVANADVLRQIVDSSRLESMAKDQWRWFPQANLNTNQAPFIRKGKKRDWVNYFSKKQSDQLDQLFHRRLAGTIAERWWHSEMKWHH